MTSQRVASNQLRVSSEPPGAFVMYSKDRSFDEEKAEVWGRTPLRRYVDSFVGVVRVSKRGFETWDGVVDDQHTNLDVKLTPLAGPDGDAAAIESPVTAFLSVVPLRVGIRKIGEKGDTLDDSQEAKTFEEDFVKKLSQELTNRFGNAAQVEKDVQLSRSAAQALWARVDERAAHVRVEKIGYYPQPIRVDIDTRTLGPAAKAGAAVGLVRVEGLYLGTGAKIARVAIPVLLSAAGAAAGAAAAASAGSSTFIYPVVGPLPTNQDGLVAQLYVVHPWTKELLWIEQASATGSYSDAAVVEGVVKKLVEALPARFAGEGNDGGQANAKP